MSHTHTATCGSAERPAEMILGVRNSTPLTADFSSQSVRNTAPYTAECAWYAADPCAHDKLRTGDSIRQIHFLNDILEDELEYEIFLSFNFLFLWHVGAASQHQEADLAGH